MTPQQATTITQQATTIQQQPTRRHNEATMIPQRSRTRHNNPTATPQQPQNNHMTNRWTVYCHTDIPSWTWQILFWGCCVLFWIVVGSLLPCCVSLWVVVGLLWGHWGWLWGHCGWLWIIVAHCGVVVDHCGSLWGRWLVVANCGSLCPCFSNYECQKHFHHVIKECSIPLYTSMLLILEKGKYCRYFKALLSCNIFQARIFWGVRGGAHPRNDLQPPKGIWHPRKLHIFWFDSFIFDYSYNQICKITNIMVSDLAMQA
jgi:hypothetical protein